MFVVHFIDDILVYIKTIAKLLEHLGEVFSTLRKAILMLSQLCARKLEYLEFIVTLDRIEVDPRKMVVILAWPFLRM